MMIMEQLAAIREAVENGDDDEALRCIDIAVRDASPKCEPPELQRLEAAFTEAGGRGVELAERIDELRKQANSGPYIEKVLALSTAHMPNEDPDFGGLRAASFEYGFVVWVSEPGDGVPEWITPAMKLAYNSGCTLILLDRDCSEDPDLPTWDW
jgi:hypothetical protein